MATKIVLLHQPKTQQHKSKEYVMVRLGLAMVVYGSALPLQVFGNTAVSNKSRSFGKPGMNWKHQCARRRPIR